MVDNVVYLHRSPREIAQVMRVGFLEHRQFEHLLSWGKLKARRFVVEAANFKRQSSLIRTLRDEDAEIILDTNAAELSVPGKFAGSAKCAPWAVVGRPLDQDDFVPGTNRSIIEPIARHAVANNINVVMAPTHYLGADQGFWFDADVRSCEALRTALDREGGADIAIDYPLIINYTEQLRNPVFRERIITDLKDLPFDYLWLRVANFGADARVAGAERYIREVLPYHELGRPIIADHLGGLAALATSAFGGVSGFAHGLESKERFSAIDWLKRRSSNGGGGGGKTIYLPTLDRRFKIEEVRRLFNEARASRAILGCSDGTCCGDIETMLSNPEAHYLVQRTRQVGDLSRTPESLRTDRFLTEHLEGARKRAQRAVRLKKGEDVMKAKIASASVRLNRLYGVLANLYEQLGPVEFASEATLRVVRGVHRDMRGGKP